MAVIRGSQTLELDSTTTTLRSIPFEHYEIHSGDSYSVCTTDTDLDDSETLIIAFTTPNTTSWLHMFVFAGQTSAGTFEILENPTITASTGTDLTVYNRNRNSSNTTRIFNMASVPVVGRATLNPTITSDGTALCTELLGTGKAKISGETRELGEIILKQDTTYAFRLTGNVNDGRASILLLWYEHANDG